jgi:hypothetical protein
LKRNIRKHALWVVNGKPEAIESIYIMKTPEAWDGFEIVEDSPETTV